MISDSRPRVAYELPDGTEVQIIHDHGDRVAYVIPFGLAGGTTVYARLKRPAGCTCCHFGQHCQCCPLHRANMAPVPKYSHTLPGP